MNIYRKWNLLVLQFLFTLTLSFDTFDLTFWCVAFLLFQWIDARIYYLLHTEHFWLMFSTYVVPLLFLCICSMKRSGQSWLFHPLNLLTGSFLLEFHHLSHLVTSSEMHENMYRTLINVAWISSSFSWHYIPLFQHCVQGVYPHPPMFYKTRINITAHMSYGL